MREIKFRAWIYSLGRMTPVKEIDFDGYMSSVMVEINSERHEQMFFENTDYPDCELMQYTGLKDKNGVEIYEGDILGGDTFRGKPHAVVRYASGMWQANGISLCSFLTPQYNTVVVGNICENAELLEVEI